MVNRHMASEQDEGSVSGGQMKWPVLQGRRSKGRKIIFIIEV